MSVNRLDVEPTFGELFNDMFVKVGELAAAHADQLREEIHANSAHARAILWLQMVGVIGTAIGVAFLLVACVHGLIDAAFWAPALAWLTVGAVTVTSSVGVFVWGQRQWKSTHVVPHETLQSFRESMSCLTSR